ncbi:hypothetical protein GN244_ATG02930 [Phytophthora infestans]|uniref:Uncharacterized protein n=1 Tax=Phytophthora infestans TaxID=4787 RepID=A0A833WKU9_PHYIN|nr:hypothetical protein GN244_ATG02930 [Phytophthora infestans]
MSQDGSSSSLCAPRLRRCSRSERSIIHRLAAIAEEHTNQSGNQPMMHRSRSEGIIRTTQGVKFEDKYRNYQTRLESLMALAADPSTSESNAKLAQKALRYRNKTLRTSS